MRDFDILIKPKAKSTAILRDLLGRIIQSECTICGRSVYIEHDAKSCRTDKKRIYHPDKNDGSCLFRCSGCGDCVHETVEGAEFEVKQ